MKTLTLEEIVKTNPKVNADAVKAVLNLPKRSAAPTTVGGIASPYGQRLRERSDDRWLDTSYCKIRR